MILNLLLLLIVGFCIAAMALMVHQMRPTLFDQSYTRGSDLSEESLYFQVLLSTGNQQVSVLDYNQTDRNLLQENARVTSLDLTNGQMQYGNSPLYNLELKWAKTKYLKKQPLLSEPIELWTTERTEVHCQSEKSCRMACPGVFKAPFCFKYQVLSEVCFDFDLFHAHGKDRLKQVIGSCPFQTKFVQAEADQIFDFKKVKLTLNVRKVKNEEL